jgi:hypothetical protein
VTKQGQKKPFTLTFPLALAACASAGAALGCAAAALLNRRQRARRIVPGFAEQQDSSDAGSNKISPETTKSADRSVDSEPLEVKREKPAQTCSDGEYVDRWVSRWARSLEDELKKT